MSRGWSLRRVIGTAAGAGVALLSSAPSVRAETVLSGGSLGAQTWTAADGPYLVKDNLTLDSLTVEAGTIVRFDSLPEKPGGLAIFVNGPLVIDARQDAPALFEPLVDRTYWWGIKAETAVVSGAVLRWGQAGIMTTSDTAPLLVRQSVFERSQLQPRSSLEVDRSRFSSGGIHGGRQGAEMTVTNSLFQNPDGNGGGWALDVQGNIFITNCTFDHFAIAFYAVGPVTVHNTIFTNLRQLVADRDNPITVSSSLLWNVSKELPNGALVDGDGIVRADPRYETGGGLRLQADSPAIDAGSDEGAPKQDLDGTSRPQGAGVDMGAYEHVLSPVAAGGQGGDATGGSGESGGSNGGSSSPAASGAGGAGLAPSSGGAPSEGGEPGSGASSTAGAQPSDDSEDIGGEAGAPVRTSSGCGLSSTGSGSSHGGLSALIASVLLVAVRRPRRRRAGSTV